MELVAPWLDHDLGLCDITRVIIFFRSYSFYSTLWTHIPHPCRTLQEMTLLINTLRPDNDSKTLSYQGDDT